MKYVSLYKISLTTLLIFLFSFTLTNAKEFQDFQLKGKSFNITVTPASLAITIQTNNQKKILVSLPQEGLGNVTITKSNDNLVEWEYPEKGIRIIAQSIGENLSIQIQSGKGENSFTWPVISENPSLKALIWPRWEGCYIPIADTTWLDYLMEDDWNTTEGLSMPFWGMEYGDSILTYIITNPYNNQIKFSKVDNQFQSQFTHEFTSNNTKKEYGFLIHLSNTTSPIEPAKVYRNWLITQGKFVPMKEKIKKVPNVERLLGAPHAYLWGSNLLIRTDIHQNQWKNFCLKLIAQSTSDTSSPGRHIKELITPQHWNEIIEISKMQYPDDYIKNEVATEISRILQLPEFYDEKSWQGIPLPQEATDLIKQDKSKLSNALLCRLNCLLLYSAFPEYMSKIEDWGDGVSLKMLHQFKDAGFDRMMLCTDGWSGIEKKPEVAIEADKIGYLLGTYDSYFSIHDPKFKGTNSSWETAQFDQNLFETGGMVGKDGKKLTGFKKFGYKLNPIAARPYVEKRVSENMKNVPYTYYFVDCDAFGQVYDDYSPLHPLTQEEYANAMMDRLAWIRDTYKTVIGSEGGNAYSTPVIHVAEGMFGPNFGWGDPDLSSKTSKFYLGAYYPPDGPKVFLQQVPIKEKYHYLYYDPRFRLPLYETVFHDSVIATNHWSNGSLKFNNILDTVEQTELLYMVPPLYHMNLDEFKKYKDRIKKHYAFFSPLHREIGIAPLTGFSWLTPDRMIQQTLFDNRVELIANFKEEPFEYKKTMIPAKAIMVRWLDNSKSQIYTTN